MLGSAIEAEIMSILAGLMGLCVGDALGVPVEFTSRSQRQIQPVTTMQGYGTWNQPPGTWSDDSSLTFCLAESLCQGFNLADIGDRFCRWYQQSYWTARNETFDVGDTTAQAINRMLQGVPPLEAGGTSERSNGNGSLMRILPMAFLHSKLNFPDLIDRVHQVSCITHAHPRSQMACGIYVSIAIALLQGDDPHTAYQKGCNRISPLYKLPFFQPELKHFDRLFQDEIHQQSIDSIGSSGYVIDTIEAALWCLLNGKTYAETVLTAVNLGDDTDTTAAVTGGLAGIYYGFEAIPKDWIEAIARRDDIIDLATRFAAVCG
nr:ADP-ribosylglycohydrolase family protein [Microcoleus sp. FACHB-1515]